MNTAKIMRGEKVRTLQDVQPSVKLKNQTYIVISPLTLFSCLIAIARDAERPEEVFKYELPPEPTSLFKDGMMRKPTKSTLHNSLLDSVPSKRGLMQKHELLMEVLFYIKLHGQAALLMVQSSRNT